MATCADCSAQAPRFGAGVSTRLVFERCDANNFSYIAVILKASNSNLAGLENALIVVMEGAGSAVES